MHTVDDLLKMRFLRMMNEVLSDKQHRIDLDIRWIIEAEDCRVN